jgi:hypothetical protein
MAEKEQRILIDVINPGINCVYRLDNDPKGQSLCKHNGNMEPVTAKECRHCDEGMTRQEAIEKMAKAFCETGAPNTWGLVEEHYKKFCLAGAEAALNALLGDK